MKTTKIILIVTLLFATSAVFISSCEKSNESSTTTLQARLTDAPASFEEVNVDIKEVRVKFSDNSADDEDWITMRTNDSVYNLLTLQGIDTVLATGTFATNLTVKEIRLILGTNNTVKVGGIVYPVTIPSGSESGLKLKVNKKLNANFETLLIDFDAALSVHLNGAGNYILTPVLKIK